MHVRERHGEIVRHPLRHAALPDLVRLAVEDDELAVESLAGADAGVAVLQQFADGGRAFQQPGDEQCQRAVLIEHVRVVVGDWFDLFRL